MDAFTFFLSHKKKIAVALWSVIFLASAGANAFADSGIIQCGRTPGSMCKLCDLIVGIHTLVTYGFSIAVIVGLTFIVVGAVIYIVSAGNTGMIEMAKSAMKDACIGIIIVFTAWLIVTYSMQVLGARADLGISATGGWSNFKCN